MVCGGGRFEEPAWALANPIRFMAYAMANATHEDMLVLRRHVTDNESHEALDRAPPGISDPRSKMVRDPATPRPTRRFG